MRILVVEDDKDISTLIAFHLKANGFETDIASNGRAAIEKLRTGNYALALLDILIPEVSGIAVLKYIRTESPHPDLPVIIASALTEEAEIIASLELGADDYITKPFSPKILVARVRSVIRRGEHRRIAGAVRTEKGIFMDPGTRKCTVLDVPVVLTATEFDMLLALIREGGRVLTRTEIIEKIKGNDYPVTERSIDVQIAALRKKLGKMGYAIKTVWGIGYRYAEEEE